MRSYKSTIKVGDKVVPILIKQYETIGEAIGCLGQKRALVLTNYSFALTQRDRKRREILATPKNKAGNLRGMCKRAK